MDCKWCALLFKLCDIEECKIPCDISIIIAFSRFQISTMYIFIQLFAPNFVSHFHISSTFFYSCISSQDVFIPLPLFLLVNPFVFKLQVQHLLELSQRAVFEHCSKRTLTCATICHVGFVIIEEMPDVLNYQVLFLKVKWTFLTLYCFSIPIMHRWELWRSSPERLCKNSKACHII